ncbi:unnamed protein product [Paramecium octaurelia]|uniref:Uncharacterized protein n=1 Tax=Paramecium octaurelia TaxID=43137 RepID=A0A8S1SHP5_PAROT|nr:unnamed protein product [Paramecium octaurelia]
MNSEAVCLKLASKHFDEQIFQELLSEGDKNGLEYVKQVWEPTEVSTSVSMESSESCGYVKKIRLLNHINKYLDSSLHSSMIKRLRELQ